ncbi:MAG: nucleoside-diphosphate kinase [Candidatus Jettenia sp.]|uniref:Nucleoside diphosphate kinase n=1 Tax=Candidatus Jettenia caeni TaxID=247490 RepID=I3IHN0_9BACT|nr:nucleoside-diphosphate kinase [Candidatus Jettenia sp. AMX1]MBC6928507.1 nucleoside-diphosphate kinase [Candidatus Jettenia sp.]WKZ16553.1 MAG: nucleoside-diphosphate kinase [Candidatus Jettenia caeni]KAA0251645.1 MAG: nucleoside-diphosphate kinase [Candidatus Jettenia sp. AMX1]MCE7879817.1 nucleoside-diphosphate kinase [Candidatus Jettenia sp. AMX1]MCQ3925903.1 nucleoside-diphosphate kinase [Candidatus Jettenia sp.]
MADELTYALITPYSLLKSRTGGILGRLLSLANLELIGATMFAPSDDFVDKYCATIEEQDIKQAWKKVMINYINSNFRKENKFGITNRTVLLFFKGSHAIEKLKDDVIGPITSFQGHTIRGSFGDFVENSDGTMEYFEPAVVTSADPITNDKQLSLFAEYLPKDGGVLEDIIKFPEGVKAETTLVILKPFEEQSPLPGNIIDMFSRTGLFIVGLKLLRMSIAQAEEFYGPLINIFREKLKPKPEKIAEKLKESFKSCFTFEVPDAIIKNHAAELSEQLKDMNAMHEFNKIIQYMTGLDPEKTSPSDKEKPGTARCLALLYRGPDAIRKIRNILGPTDSKKGEPGKVRRIYGEDIMKNAAHASDAVENAERERKIIGLWENKEPYELKEIIEDYLRKK